MDELEPFQTVMLNVLEKLSEISSSLNDISGKLDNLSGVYGLDDVIQHLDDGVDKIVGPIAYNLTDIHQALTEIETTLITKD